MGSNHPIADSGRRIAARAHLGARELLRGSLAVGGLHKPIEWAYWFGNDVGRFFRYGDEGKEFGIIAYCGLFGRGKTISMVERAYRKKQRYGEKLKIWANCPVAFADGAIESYDQLIECHEDGRNHLFLFDEIHLSWDQGEWKTIDPELLTALTQQRKWGGGFAVYYSTQRLVQTATIWRRLAEFIVDCDGWPTSRWIHQKAYAGIEEYNEGMPRRNPMTGEDQRNIAWTHSFIADDFLRTQYRTDWVAKRIEKDHSSVVIGEKAVKKKMAADAAFVADMLQSRNGAPAALAGGAMRK